MNKKEFDHDYGTYRQLWRKWLTPRAGEMLHPENDEAYGQMFDQKWAKFEGWTNKRLCEQWLMKRAYNLIASS